MNLVVETRRLNVTKEQANGLVQNYLTSEHADRVNAYDFYTKGESRTITHDDGVAVETIVRLEYTR